MKDKRTPRQFNRRQFLRWSGRGAMLALFAGSVRSVAARQVGRSLATSGGISARPAPPVGPAGAPANVPAQQLPRADIRLAATDGYVSLPGRRIGTGQGIYVFGFRGVDPGDTFATPQELIQTYKGFVQWPSPVLGVGEDTEVYLTLTNLGLEVRPDLDDAHTIHWHGFRNPTAVFDGVPEVSVSVPPARDFPYYALPRDEGTYMYHCHFEDVEHVQMGMDGIIFVRPALDPFYAYNDPLTAFDREFSLLLNEVDTTPHDNLEAVQEFVWSDYEPNFWVINGRAYPDTILRDQDLPGSDFDLNDPVLGYTQPVSSLIQVEESETALLRFANLGYEQQSMQLLGIRMTVVGHDASYLGNNAYDTSTIYIGPGEARDVLFVAPDYSPALPGGSDGAGDYNVYWLRNRNAQRMVNDNQPGLGGMVTQVRVYPGGALGFQAGPNVTV